MRLIQTEFVKGLRYKISSMIRKTELSNGLKILTEKVPDLHSASLIVLVGAGSAVESVSNNGISHFIEHLMFKGTENRSSQIIAQTIEDYGGTLNAFTEKEITVYYARVLSEQVSVTLDIFCDMLLNSLFNAEELELERQVILEEIKMYEDTPDELVYDLLFKTVWGNNSFAFPVTGCYDSVKHLGRDEILNYVNNLYTPDNIVFSISGNFDFDEVITKIKSHFDDIKSSKKPFALEKPVTTSNINVAIKDIEQAHVCLATRGFSITSEDRFPMAVLDICLAGGISSRLFQEVREKRGLAYSINSYKALYKPSGLFGVYAGTSANNVDEVVKIVIDEFAKVRQYGLTEDELLRSKKQLKGSMLLGLESSYYRAYRHAHSESYFEKIYSIEEVCNTIDKITMDDVKRISSYMFRPEFYSMSVVGPKEVQKDYKIF